MKIAPVDFINADCQGYLLKLDGRSKCWKTRFCLLSDAFLYLYVDKESESALGKYSIRNIKYSPWPEKIVKSKEMLENSLLPSQWCLSLSLCRMIRNQNKLLDILYILWIDEFYPILAVFVVFCANFKQMRTQKNREITAFCKAWKPYLEETEGSGCSLLFLWQNSDQKG